MSTTAMATAPKPTLFELEHNHQALIQWEESTPMPAEERAELEAFIAREFQEVVAKRDRFGDFIHHCENQVANIDAELERLHGLKRIYQNTLNRSRGIIVRIIETLGLDERGKYRVLEGTRSRFSIRSNPVSVEVPNEAAVPLQYKRVAITLPAEAWRRIAWYAVEAEPELAATIRQAEEHATTSLNKKEIKAVIENGGTVEGADLVIGGHTLLIR